jgi:phosphoribosylformylglycinamidine cyclo-ligase
MRESYRNSVNYDTLDLVKKMALDIFEPTFSYPERLGIRFVPESLGGTVPVFDFSNVDSNHYIAHIIEGLGTKNMVADAMYKETGDPKYYNHVGTDTARMAVNDIVAMGADPFSYDDMITCGTSEWFSDDMEKARNLFLGYKDAADEDGFAIAGGETPELQGIVFPETLDLAGSCIGFVKPRSRLIPQDGSSIQLGDIIYGVSSSSVHANGLGKIRRIAAKLKDGYFTIMSNGSVLGEEVLIPTACYSKPMNECFDQGVEMHFVQPITGHGWEKIGRANKPFTYSIEYIPEPQPLFRDLIELGKRVGGFDMSDKENYFAWNMSMGWVVIAPKTEGSKLSRIFGKYGMNVDELGTVEAGERVVHMKPLGFKFNL